MNQIYCSPADQHLSNIDRWMDEQRKKWINDKIISTEKFSGKFNKICLLSGNPEETMRP